MNTFKKIIAGMMIFVPGVALSQIIPVPGNGGGPGSGNSYNGNLLNSPALSNSVTPVIDMSVYDGSRVSAQIIYATVTFASTNFQDGAQSSGSVDVISATGLSSASATNQVTITSNSFTTIPVLTVGNYVLTMGVQWGKGSTKAASAVNLAAAISALPNFSASASNGVVYATAAYGSYANTIGFVSNNSSMTVLSATMTGGADNACLTIGGIPLCQGVKWTVGATTTTAVLSLGNAIAAAVSVSTKAVGPLGVIYATSTLNGSAYNYTLVSSTPSVLSVVGPAMTGGRNADFSLGSGLFSTTTASGYSLALPVLYSAQNTPAISGLSGGTTYYYYPVSSFKYELAKYSTSAVAGAPQGDFVSVTSTNSGTSAHTYTITPLSWGQLGNTLSTATWQSSNDGSNWFTAYSTSSASVVPALTISSLTVSGNVPYDFGVYNFRYLRLNYAPNISGALNISVPVNIKQDGIGRF